MKRYQVYLNPHSVSVLDDFEKLSTIPRSKMIREAIDRWVEQLVKVFSYRQEVPRQLKYLDKLVGSIDTKDRKPTNYALDEDDVYLKD